MILLLELILGLTLGFSLPLRGDERADALAVIEQAIQAHGGADRLARAQTMTRQAKGVIFVVNKPQRFTTKLLVAYPNRLRDQIVIEADTAKINLTRVLNRDKGWDSSGGMTMDMSKEQVDELQQELYVLWLSTLVPLKDANFDLAFLGDSKIDQRSVTGVKVSGVGRSPLKLYFDRETHLLTHIQRSQKIANLDVTKEYRFGEFKDFDGVKFPTQQVELLQGRKSTELVIQSVEIPASIDETTFAKP
jgi:hypothetical protein